MAPDTGWCVVQMGRTAAPVAPHKEFFVWDGRKLRLQLSPIPHKEDEILQDRRSAYLAGGEARRTLLPALVTVDIVLRDQGDRDLEIGRVQFLTGHHLLTDLHTGARDIIR